MNNKKRVGILTDGQLDLLKAKMAHGVMRYREDVVLVIDKKFAGKTVDEIIGYVEKKIPIVSDIYEAIEKGIDELLIGIAPPNGELPDEWIDTIRIAVNSGVRIVNGLHLKLSSDERLSDLDKAFFDDLRFHEYDKKVATGKASQINKNVILTLGSDCGTGKMTTAIELKRACEKSGLKSAFIPTGQTGMYIADSGIAIDSVVADFISGVTESMVCESAEKNDYVFVEGQGSLCHSAYSGVTLGLLHGAAPNMVVFCHDISRSKLEYFDHEIIDIENQISMIEGLGSYQRECHVIGISLFAKGVSKEELEIKIDKMEKKYGIPVFAPLITGCDKMVKYIEKCG